MRALWFKAKCWFLFHVASHLLRLVCGHDWASIGSSREICARCLWVRGRP